ncbi:MAG: TetR/AcrR family transcriptional regulator [Bacteroidota bacterium]
MDIRNRIIEQASQMFTRYGIRSITMDEIAESLGISKRTLYESFSNKEELLKECIEFQYQENVKIRDGILAENPNDPLEIIHQHFRQLLIFLNNLNPSYLNDLKKYHSNLFLSHITDKQNDNIAFTRLMIHKGIEKGLFRSEADPEIMSVFIHTVMQIITTEEIFPETRFARAEVVRQILLNFIRGLATENGLKQIDEKFNQNA